ncbi:MAG: HD domain-containing protein [bacterium]|nr:HD domain-containing protein [bacterium]
MSMYIPKQKIVYDPVVGLIDIGDFLPMIDVRQFQSLAFKYQFGLAFLLFPAATHTRKQHCLGAFQRTKDLARRWVTNGMITKDQALTVTAYALYHDIGHGPFSHTVEPFFDLMPGAEKSKLRADDAMALQIVKELRKEIEGLDIDFDALYKLFEHKDPLYLAVHDKNLGMEKFDYLERDALYTINEKPGVDYLSQFIYFIDGQAVVDEKVIDQARSIQAFYIKMSKDVYLRKKSAIIQRMVQKMAHELIKDGLHINDMWKLTDFGLLGRFEISENLLIKDYYDRLRAGNFPKIAIEFKNEQFLHMNEHRNDKSLDTIGLPVEMLDKLLSHHKIVDLNGLAELEQEIADIAGIPHKAVIAVPPFSSHRFVPEDVKVYGQGGKIVMLSDYYPQHFAAMVEYGRSHQLLRICAFQEYRDILSQNAKEVKDHLLSLIA